MTEAFTPNVISRLTKYGIEEPWELLLNLPERYDDFTLPIKSIGAIKRLGHGKSFYGKLILTGVKTSTEIKKERQANGEVVDAGSGTEYVRVELSDGVSSTSALVFGRIDPWLLLKKVKLGKVIHVSGKVKQKNGYTNLDALEVVPEEDIGKIVARYRGMKRVLSPEKIADLTKISLIHNTARAVEEIMDGLNEEESGIRKNCRLPFNLQQLLMMLHIPDSPENLKKALDSAKRMNAYYEIRKALAATERKPCPEARIPKNLELIQELVSRHPFAKTITNDQKRAVWDIIKDFDQDKPMDRLLSADVGNGKTLAYGIPAAYACRLGKNVVVLLPTEPLAGQVAENISGWYPEVKVHLLTAGFKDEVKQGEMLVGTTAILTWLKNNPEWKVDFAVTDEQQKMGTLQRDALNSIGTHILEATATPIPRTMAQTLFGSKKVSVIKDCPVVKNITTKLIGNTIEERRDLMTNLEAWVAKGSKVAVIYPLVAEQQAYYYHVKAEVKKEAEKVASLMKKANVSVKSINPVEEVPHLLHELENTAEDGFIIELHAEEQAHNRLQKRFDRYMGASAELLRFMGSRIDEEMEQKNKTTIMNAAAKWEKKFPGRVGVIHGRSKRTEKADIIRDMNNGKYDILVSTTLVEIGVDVKGLMALAAINAENLGAYTLHQLRGRVARSGGDGDFFMMASCPVDELEPGSKERMDLLVKYTSGDDIAVYDMEQRGFGNLSAGGRNQKGFDDGLFPTLKLVPSELEHFLRDLARETMHERGAQVAVTP
ncbi:DEAD/DEAH box helicase [Pseudomonas putida]|uniref:DEAD/DEAH box helicase n=1 Tax=Pseudomonas putida TaxID=303 RepID=A0A8I1EC47_PSEPU|nr:DEAD/DEAH box helicase [Pseudomonas putida]MBI6882946.1 DEAD/DEAH box helicase [Pseudomonas putida]